MVGCFLNKMMITRFPINVILMEAATLLESRSQWLDLTWSPREKNVEADRQHKKAHQLPSHEALQSALDN